MAIGKIERVDLREVWAHEAHDFTTWLAQNIDVVSEATELSLSSVEREQAAGSFSVDLVAEEADGGTVVIENQLGRSDHDHLGKLLTYLSAFEARAAVWIVGDARPEHTAAVAWLNESTAADFYLLKAEAIRIGDSAPALLLTRIVGPSEEAKAVGTEKREQSDRERIRRAFWGELLERAKQRTPLHTGVNPSRHPWQGTGAGIAGLSYQYGIRQHAWSVFLYIDRGSACPTKRTNGSLRTCMIAASRSKPDLAANFHGTALKANVQRRSGLLQVRGDTATSKTSGHKSKIR
ncbi:MAG: DUF4268 domain-containing protein [Phycisphaerales bacterium]